MLVRAATVAECDRLTEIALAAKRHWRYPEEWIELWRSELIYSPERFVAEEIFVVERDGRVDGVCSLCFDGDSVELESLWVDPKAMGHGLGRVLLEEAIARARGRGVEEMVIVADPHAESFYEKFGAKRVGTKPSKPAGRMLPELRLALSA
jgi:N-acetylglutamate synthase-like GNAT family acetyltransferase